MKKLHGIELGAGTAAFLDGPQRMMIGGQRVEAVSGETLPVID